MTFDLVQVSRFDLRAKHKNYYLDHLNSGKKVGQVLHPTRIDHHGYPNEKNLNASPLKSSLNNLQSIKNILQSTTIHNEDSSPIFNNLQSIKKYTKSFPTLNFLGHALESPTNLDARPIDIYSNSIYPKLHQENKRRSSLVYLFDKIKHEKNKSNGRY